MELLMKTCTRILTPMLFVMLGLFTSVSVFAQVPSTMTYNGFLMSNGSPANTPADVSFKIFDSEIGGNSLWQQNPSSVDIKAGRFSARLSNLNAGLFNGQTRWLEVTINNETLAPRTEVGSMPYAFRAGDALTIQGKTPDQLSGGGGGPDTLASLNCNNGQIAFFTAGKWACTNMPSYTGTNFATSGQNCPAGQIVSGIAADGKVTCVADKNDNTTYSGTNFATSGQACPAGQIVSGISATGTVICAIDKDTNTTYSGANFATSNQSCPTGQVVRGITATGAVNCVTDTNSTYTAGAGLSLSGTTFVLSSNQSFSGTVTASEFKYSTPKSVRFSIPHHEFSRLSNPSHSNVTWHTDYLEYSYPSGGSGTQILTAYATIHLPQSSIVRSMSCYVVDRAPSKRIDVYPRLIRKKGSEATITNIFNNSSPSLVTDQNGVSDTPQKATINGNHTVSNEYAYTAIVKLQFPQGTSQDLRFHGCEIDVTVSGT